MFKIKLLFILVLAISFLGGEDSHSAQLGPQRILRKASRKLQMGKDPSAADQAQLAELVKANGPQSPQVKAFIDSKIMGYVKSPEFKQKMTYHLQTLLRFSTFVKDENGKPITDSQFGEDDLLGSTYEQQMQSGAYGIISDVIDKNAPWDQLLTAKTYKTSDQAFLHDPKKSTFFDELSFLNEIKPVAVSSSNNSITFKSDEPRVGGILSSLMFRARYHAGPSNENRRLAQAVFRSFLCDNLQPSFIPSSSEDEENIKLLQEIIKMLTGGTGAPPPGMIDNMMNANNIKHGTEASCMSCHYKLDPLGKTFGTPGSNVLPKDPSAGALVFKRLVGQEENTQADGIGTLAKAIVNTPEFYQCQVNHFWNWFIGSEVPLSDKRKNDLADIFSGKKPVTGGVNIGKNHQEFISHLVRQPEFQTDINALDPNSPEAMASLLQSCNMCHAAVNKPTFQTRPFGGSLEKDAAIVAALKFRVLEVPITDPKSMPPNRASWSEGDVKRLTDWVKKLKPMEGGN